MDQRALVVNRC